MAGIRSDLARMSLPARWALLGAVFLGVAGAIAGLIIGLLVYPPTAWFAVFEGGLPAAAVGGGAGLLGGLAVGGAHRVKRR